jgi:tetratricopeptide (TPR) repeat protein
MSDNAQFDASLPPLYAENWREAYRPDSGDSPRMASYQAPGGEPIPFIQKGFRFSGGQAQDTAEYPFGGLWSNEYLNEKPQRLTVEGFLRGPVYIARRNNLIEALRIPTDDDNPGYIDLPFWGRFPVIVGDNYEVSENTNEQGQCEISIPFTRAGVSITDRKGAQPPSAAQVEKAAENLEDAATAAFEADLTEKDNATFAQAFGQIKNTLLGILGRIQGAQTALNAMTGEVLGVTNLINQGVRAPRELARALFNAASSIAGGIQQIKNSIAMYGREINTNTQRGSSLGTPTLPAPDNERNAAILFLSAGAYSVPVETATVRQENTKRAIENLYRTAAFLTAAQIIANMDSITYKNAGGYWQLLEKLEESINRENPAVYAAIQDVRTALSRELSGQELSRELSRDIYSASPLLYLAFYLGCGEDKIRELNSIADSFVIEGNVIYV